MSRIILMALLTGTYILHIYASNPLSTIHSVAENRTLATASSPDDHLITQEFNQFFWYNIFEQKAWIVRHNNRYKAAYKQPSPDKDVTKDFLHNLVRASPGLVLTCPGLMDFLRR